MIYNLISKLKTDYPSLTFTNILDTTKKDTLIIVRENGSSLITGWPTERVDVIIQIISRSQDNYTARQNIFTIYNDWKENFDFNLPEVLAIGEPEINIAKCIVNQYPMDMGVSQNGIHEWVLNITFIFADR